MTPGHDISFDLPNDSDALAPSVPPVGRAVRSARGWAPC
jgi:hypothetical protein